MKTFLRDEVDEGGDELMRWEGGITYFCLLLSR
jgi:hypothetical protein